MKAKHLFLAILAVLAAGGLWLARSARRSDQFVSHKSSTGAELKSISENADTGGEKPGENPGGPEPKVSSRGQPNLGQMPGAPEPNRRFTGFTPEQRVQFARQGHGPGG